jgi:hypothetical protein
MIKNVLPIALLGICLINTTACKNAGGGGEFKKTASGLEYKIVKDEPGTEKPKAGDFVEVHVLVHVKDGAKDTVLFNSRLKNNNKPLEFQIQSAQQKPDPMEGFMQLTKGDSAVFRIPIDSMMKSGQPMPPFMKKGGFLEYNVVLVSVKSLEQKKTEDEANAAKQKEADDKLLQDYFTKNNIHPTKT